MLCFRQAAGFVAEEVRGLGVCVGIWTGGLECTKGRTNGGFEDMRI